MEDQKMTLKKVFPLGLMLFSFFFGAGNLIFPPVLGQMAGDNLLAATLGFCFSGVGFRYWAFWPWPSITMFILMNRVCRRANGLPEWW